MSSVSPGEEQGEREELSREEHDVLLIEGASAFGHGYTQEKALGHALARFVLRLAARLDAVEGEVVEVFRRLTISEDTWTSLNQTAPAKLSGIFRRLAALESTFSAITSGIEDASLRAFHAPDEEGRLAHAPMTQEEWNVIRPLVSAGAVADDAMDGAKVGIEEIIKLRGLLVQRPGTGHPEERLPDYAPRPAPEKETREQPGPLPLVSTGQNATGANELPPTPYPPHLQPSATSQPDQEEREAALSALAGLYLARKALDSKDAYQLAEARDIVAAALRGASQTQEPSEDWRDAIESELDDAFNAGVWQANHQKAANYNIPDACRRILAARTAPPTEHQETQPESIKVGPEMVEFLRASQNRAGPDGVTLYFSSRAASQVDEGAVEAVKLARQIEQDLHGLRMMTTRDDLWVACEGADGHVSLAVMHAASLALLRSLGALEGKE